MNFYNYSFLNISNICNKIFRKKMEGEKIIIYYLFEEMTQKNHTIAYSGFFSASFGINGFVNSSFGI